jgi:hypothetical protein
MFEEIVLRVVSFCEITPQVNRTLELASALVVGNGRVCRPILANFGIINCTASAGHMPYERHE